MNTMLGQLQLLFERKGITGEVKATTYRKIENSVHINHPYPINYNPVNEKLFEHYTNYQSQNEEVYELRNVCVSERGIVFKGINNYGDAFPHTVFRTQYGWLYILKHYLFFKKTKAPQKTLVLLYDFWSAGNYYHWIVDSLPRLAIVSHELRLNGYSLLLPKNPPAYISASLRYFELSDITYISKGTYLETERLLVPYYLAGSGHIHPPRVKAVKDFFVPLMGTAPGHERIFVSRSRQKARRVHNEHEVIDVVKSLGFKVIYFEDYTFEQQVELAKGVKVMVSSHGANMTNCMFMPDGSRVLELIREDNPNFCYWALASVAGLRYHYQLCRVVGNDHLNVDIAQFRLNLNRLLND